MGELVFHPVLVEHEGLGTVLALEVFLVHVYQSVSLERELGRQLLLAAFKIADVNLVLSHS